MISVNRLRERLNPVNPSIALELFARRARRVLDRIMRGGSRVGNIAMLHAGRCGSSVLADLLDQRPDVVWAGELFENMPAVYYRMDAGQRAHERIANAMYRHDTPYFGFDSKYLPEQHLHPNLANKSVGEYVDLLDRLGFRHFILLNRRNHLRRAVSVSVGTKTGQWNTFGEVNKATVRLDPQRFVSYSVEMPLLDYFRGLDDVHAHVRKALGRRRVLELEYEADIERNPQQAYDKACTWLELPAHPVRVRLKKLNDRALPEIVENFDEIERLLRRTPYEWMLSA